MPPASDFARRAVALADAIVRLSRDASIPIDESTVNETLKHANELDDSDPLSAARIEHAHHRAAISIIDDARAEHVLVTRRGAESASDFDAAPGAFRSFDAARLTRTLSHALTCAETSGAASACYGTIEVVMESCTIDEAADVVAWMEANRERLRKEETWKKGKLTTLRTLIALCKRCVGRSTREARTRGSAIMLQSWLMDVTDRSGLNTGGQSNPNVTPIFEQEEWTRQDGERSFEDGEMEIDGAEGAEDGAASSAHGIDAEFHKTFWSLQAYYQNPLTTMCRNGAWNSFYANLRVVLDKFEEHPLTEAAKTLDLSPESEIYQLIGQRYLTARRLLPLQMRDYSFRRQILIQTALFLEAMTTEKFKEHVVEEEVTEGGKRVMEILKRTGPNAQVMAEFIEECVEDEAGWRKWRDEGYPSFVREPIDFEKEPMPDNWDIKYSQWPPDQFPPNDPRFKEDYGDENLNKVMNVSDEVVMNANMSAAFPSITVEEFFRPCLEEMDPENQIEENYKKVNDEVFRWQAMRLLTQNHMHLFPKISAEGLESVVPEILGVPDPRPPKNAGEAGNKAEEIDYNQDTLTLLGSYVEGFDSDLDSLEDEDEDEDEKKKADVAKVETAEDEMMVEDGVEEVAVKAEQNVDVKVEEKVEVRQEAQTPSATESPVKQRSPEPETKAPPSASNAAPRGGQGRGPGRRGEGRQDQQGRGRQQVRAVRPPPRQQQPPPRQQQPPPQQPPPRQQQPPPQQPPQRRREPSREPQRREPPPQRDQPRPQQQRESYMAPHPQPRGLTQWDRGGRDQVRDEPPRRDAPPLSRQQGSNLGKRGREDDGPHGGGQRARGNQGQRYNRGPNRRR